MTAVLAVLHYVINGRLAHFRVHKPAFFAVTATVAETIFAAQIAILRRHKAQGFYKSLFAEGRHACYGRREKLTFVLKGMKLPKCLFYFRQRIFAALFHSRYCFFVVCAIEDVHDVINKVVHQMNRAAVNVE